MKLYTPQNSELMNVSAIWREGNTLVIEGTIMGAMPTRAVLRPDEARKAFALLKPAIWPFLLSFIFRKSPQKDEIGSLGLDGLLDDY